MGHHRRHPDVGVPLRRHTVETRRGDADHGQQLLIDNNVAAQHGWVRAETISPQVIAEHRQRMPTRNAVVLAGEQPPDHRLDSQHLEVIARYEFLLRELVAAARSRYEPYLGYAAGSEHAVEKIRAACDLSVERQRHRPRSPTAGAMDRDQLLRMRYRQHAQHQRVKQRENRRVGSDTERQRNDRRGREAGAAAQAAQRVADVFGETFEPREAALVAIGFLGVRHAAELAARGGAGFRLAHSAPPEFLLHHLQMQAHLIIQFAVEACPADQLMKAHPNSGHGLLHLRQPLEAVHDGNRARPVLGFSFHLPASRGRDFVKLGAPVIAGDAPARADPSAVLQPQQRRVQRPLVQVQHAAGDLLNPLRQPETVLRPHGGQRPQHHQVQRALEYIRFGFSCRHPKGVCACSFRMSRGVAR